MKMKQSLIYIFAFMLAAAALHAQETIDTAQFWAEYIIRKTICPKSQNDLSEEWGDNTAFFGRLVFRRIAIP